jgi:tetratricopeptide (TPR) repeat protein
MQTRNAHEHFLRARELFLKMKNWEKVGFANLQLGLAYSQENELDSAISFFQRAITIYTDHDLSRHLWTPYMGISNVYGKAENISAAFRYGRKAIASLKPEVDRVSKVIAYNHMLRLAREQDSLHIYAIYADELLKLYSPIEINDQVLQHIDHFVNIKDPSERIDAIQTAIRRHNQWPPTLELVSLYYQLGQSYMEIKHFHEALKALFAAYAIEKDSLKIVHFTPVLLRALSTQYEQLGQYPKALEFYKKYESVKDSLVQENTKARTEELQLQFESRAKDQQITGQQQLVERLTNQRNLIIGLSVVLLLAGGYVMYIQRRYLKDQAIIALQKEALHQNEINQLKKQHEVANLQTLITTQEEERKRIAQDLHDSLGALLATLRNKTYPSNNIDISSTQDQLRLIDTVYYEVSRIAYIMMLPSLIIMGLSAAFDDLLDALQQ